MDREGVAAPRGRDEGEGPATRAAARARMRFVRGASTDEVSRSRAARDAVKRPHLVLVDALYQMSRVLPRTSVEATCSRAEIFKRLPLIFTPWFELKMLKLIQSNSGNLRTEREARTLVEVADVLLLGQTVPALMLVTGRLKALADAHTPGSGGWSSA